MFRERCNNHNLLYLMPEEKAPRQGQEIEL